MSIILAGRLIDGTDAAPRKNVALVVEDGRIVAVEPAGSINPLERQVIDLSDWTVLPGLIDAHVHLAFEPGPDHATAIALLRSEGPARAALRAAAHAQQVLLGGVTTVRDCGGPGLATLAVRDAIDSGLLVGPRVLAAGPAITTSAGHLHFLGARADTRDEAIRLVRRLVEKGVDFIKVCVTGGNMTAGSNSLRCQYDVETLAALVSDAHRLGSQVAVHAHGVAGIAAAVAAGVDTIEHCSWAAEEGPAYDPLVARRLRETGAYATFTFTGLQRRMLDPEDTPRSDGASALAKSTAVHRRMLADNLPVMVASDAGVRFTPFHEFAQTLEVMVQGCGVTPAAAIRAATVAPAQALGLAGVLGTLEPGKVADMVAVRSDPLADIRSLRRPEAVLRAGRVVVWDGRLAAGV